METSPPWGKEWIVSFSTRAHVRNLVSRIIRSWKVGMEGKWKWCLSFLFNFQPMVNSNPYVVITFQWNIYFAGVIEYLVGVLSFHRSDNFCHNEIHIRLLFILWKMTRNRNTRFCTIFDRSLFFDLFEKYGSRFRGYRRAICHQFVITNLQHFFFLIHFSFEISNRYSEK